jgi:hypothetical protein
MISEHQIFRGSELGVWLVYLGFTFVSGAVLVIELLEWMGHA